jgi:Ca2+-binding RTX toxin-like protein
MTSSAFHDPQPQAFNLRTSILVYGSHLSDTTPPNISTPDLAAASDSGVSSSDNITNASILTFNGFAEAGSVVKLWEGSTLLGTTTATSGGVYSFGISVLAEGSHTVHATASDAAGNTATTGNLTVLIDRTAPTISAQRDTATNPHGWNNTDVDSSYAASDAHGLASPATGGFTFIAEGAGQSHEFTVTDLAGNSASATVSGVNIDKTAPSITATIDKLPAGTGWYNIATGAPTITYSASDALSGGVSSPAAVTPGSGADQNLRVTVTDLAGNSATVTLATLTTDTTKTVGLGDIDVDLVAPTITGGPDRAANGHGWYNADVTVSFDGTDGLSGVDTISSPTTLGEGANQSVTGTASDKAGNSASLTVGSINIDKTAPTISYTRTAANGNGWNNTDVVVDFSGADGLSGVDAVTGDTTVSTEGANQSVTGTVTDEAGNSVSFTVSEINIDKTAPAITAQRDTAANAHGWNNTDVASSYSASDTLSGLASSATAGYTFTAEGAGQSHTFTVTDLAGNSASATVSAVNIDKTAPDVQIAGFTTAVPGEPVVLTDISTDALSGLDLATRSWQSGAGSDVTYTLTPTAPGSYTVTLSLKDNAGNEKTASHVITVDTAILRGGDLLVGGTLGDDHIIFTPGSKAGDVVAKLNGVSLGTFTPTGRLMAYGQAGSDDIQVAGSLTLPAWLYGGDGDDRMKGGAGNDVMLGEAGEDLLIGGDGRDLLIGGVGADRIIGNADDDVLIAGYTVYDNSPTALAAIMAEWTRADLTATERIAHLNGPTGGLNGNYFLTTKDSATVLDDGAADVLTGGAGADWFITDGQVKDKVTDWSSYEQSYSDDVTFMNAEVG